VTAPQFAEAREELGAKVAAAKGRRFSEVVEAEGWEALFEPKGEGGEDYCQVCQREPKPEESLVPETTDAGETVKKCEQCRSFETLARAIAYHPLWMVVSETDASMEEGGWRGTLARLTGFAYRFEHKRPELRTPGTVYILNDTDLEAAGVSGFRFIANVTPRIGSADIDWVEENHPDLELPPGEPIKDFALMALQSEGIHRVGVLRMDVDNLGAIFGQYLQSSMAQLSTLSAAMDLFFTGYLNQICWQVGAKGEHDNVIYVIYAGGDDLFVLGSWDRMPVLAKEIKRAFREYTGHNPNLTISGGVTLEDRKFPLYRAAERAGEAEAMAKGYTHSDGHEKDAFCFLGQVVGWGEEWNLVQEQKENLLWLIGEAEEETAEVEEDDSKRLPRALLQAVQSIYQLYVDGLRESRRRAREEGEPAPDPRMYFGRWMWMQVYSLGRMAQRSRNEEVPGRVQDLQDEIFQPDTVRLSGLAARWAEYLTRGVE
jgi:CRISPR-associated protein Csm1